VTRTSLAIAAVLLVLAAPAAADVPFGPCPSDGLPSAGGQCATVTVPLDRAGAVPGTIDVGLERLPAHGASRGTLLALAGGPGDAASAFFARGAAALDALRTDHDVVLVDQRGTGRSGPLDCPLTPADCARRLGPAAGLYTTAAFADDLEDVRAALGADKVTLFGVSYGTYAATAYARRHLDRVEALVLDSVLDQPMADDRFNLESFAALPGALRSFCAGARCRGVTKDPYADLLAVIRRISTGRITDVNDAQVGLALLLSDVNANLRVELPAALASARRGDTALLRHAGDAAALQVPYDPRLSSDGLNTAASCEDYAPPWDRSLTDPAARTAEARRRFAAIPARRFAPFAPDLVYLSLDAAHCADWPIAPVSPAVTGPLPDVPALILSGGADLRTPESGARRVAHELPRAKLQRARTAGHAVSFDEPCAQRAVAAFLTGRTVAACRLADAAWAPLALPPHRAPRTLKRLAAVTYALTVNDALARADTQRGRAPTDRFAGLRGGYVTRRGDVITLHRVVVVPGIAVSGTERHLRTRRV
jgi:pimeloyl-ACP methyl ester carboxylesterase